MKKLVIAWVGAAMLTACSTAITKPQRDPIITALMGKPVAYVQDRLGLPNRRNELATGAMVWIYFDVDRGMMERDCQVSLSFRNGIVENVHITKSTPSLMSYVASGCKRIRREATGA